MTPTERASIEKEAKKYAASYSSVDDVHGYHNLHQGYVAGAIAEHERLSKLFNLNYVSNQIKEARNQAIDDVLLKVMSFTRYSKATPITINELKEILESLKTKP